MSAVLNRASRNFLWRHPWQLALAILGIALGVAVVISIDLAMESSLKAFDQAGNALSGTATHRIVASDGGLDEKLYRRLRVDRGIQKLAPVVSGYVDLSNRADTGFNLIGVDPFIEKSFQSVWQSRQDEDTTSELLIRLVSEPDTVLISKQTALTLGLEINDDLSITTVTGEHQLKIIGFLFPNNAVSEQVLSGLMIADIATAQEVLGLFGRLSSIEVVTDKRRTGVLEKIRNTLPGNALLVSAENQSQAIRQMTRAFSINLKALGLLSLLVGMFLIYNTMTFLVMQRRRLIGSLRSIGVTRTQIFRLIIGEALLLAIIGALTGIVLGIVLGQGLLHLISGTLNAIYFHIDATALMITPQQLGKGLFLGVSATLLAVMPPAFEATRLSPLTVMVRSQLESGVRSLIKAASIMSCFFTLGGIGLVVFSGKSIGLGLAGIFLLLLGFALLTPVITLMLMALTERVFGRFSGILMRLPARMISAEISRSGIAIAALMIAVSATIGMDLMIGSFRQTVSDWVKTSLRADLYIALPGEKTPGARAGDDHLLKAKLAELQGIQMVSSVLHTRIVIAKDGAYAASRPGTGAAANGDFAKVSVFELNEKSRKGFIFKHKTDNELWDKFERQQTVIITEPYAYHQNIKVGDKIQLQTGRGNEPFEVIGIYADYSGDQGHLAMSRRNYLRYWPDLGYSGIGVYARDSVHLKQLEYQLGKLLTGRQSVKSDQAIYQASMKVFEQTFTVTETLRWLSAIIAFVGVFSTLMALQFERVRQLGILRALGVTPKQLTTLITLETGLMGLIAGLIAIPVGYIVAYLLIFVIYRRSFGWTMAFNFDSGVIWQGLALALISATLAGIFPALKMAQTKPAEALRSE